MKKNAFGTHASKLERIARINDFFTMDKKSELSKTVKGLAAKRAKVQKEREIKDALKEDLW